MELLKVPSFHSLRKYVYELQFTYHISTVIKRRYGYGDDEASY